VRRPALPKFKGVQRSLCWQVLAARRKALHTPEVRRDALPTRNRSDDEG
jgi:hypothetical protein